MLIGIGILLAIIGAIFVWFFIPYSPIKREFEKDIEGLQKETEHDVMM